MAKIIYSVQRTEKNAGILSEEMLHTLFAEAAQLNRILLQAKKRIAYFFIDPLMNSFEASNHFYFKIMGCEAVNKLNCYKSGAGPLQALADADELIEHGIYDAVFICGYEPLLTNKVKYGKAAIQQSMDIFSGPSILSCYHDLAKLYNEQLGINADTFEAIAEALFQNYARTFARTHPKANLPHRGPQLDTLFCLTDCANPNLDFAGGIIIADQATASHLNLSELVDVLSVHCAAVAGDPKNLNSILGSPEHAFPHLQEVLVTIQKSTRLDLVQEVKSANMLLDLYTCYPPIPLAFLLISGLAKNIEDLLEFLDQYEITVDGGLNLGGAPWNNPVLSSLVTIHKKLPTSPANYALIHGNGGIGEVQGAALLGKEKRKA